MSVRSVTPKPKSPNPITTKFTAGKLHLEKDSRLRKCFRAIVDRKELNLDEYVLFHILKNEIGMKLETLPSKLVEALPIIFAYYMKTWPGWQRNEDYIKGKLSYKEWLGKFVQYIVLKMNFVVQTGFDKACAEIEKNKKEIDFTKNVERGTQTDNCLQDIAPFRINITCGPDMLSTLVFFGCANDSIKLKMHPVGKWEERSPKILLNWPFIKIKFISPQIKITREVVIDYQRFVCKADTAHRYIKPDFIEEISIIDSSKPRNCYTSNFMEYYLNKYKSVWKGVPKDKMSPEKYQEICTLLDEFYKDIIEIDIDSSIPTNTVILFNIGKQSYTRNKKITKSYDSSLDNKIEVAFTEYIVPKVRLSFQDFCDYQDENAETVSFVNLNKIQNAIQSKEDVTEYIPVLTYSCTFCEALFEGKENIIKHLREKHKIEQNVMCVNCRREILFGSDRWVHDCSHKYKSRKTL